MMVDPDKTVDHRTTERETEAREIGRGNMNCTRTLKMTAQQILMTAEQLLSLTSSARQVQSSNETATPEKVGLDTERSMVGLTERDSRERRRDGIETEGRDTPLQREEREGTLQEREGEVVNAEEEERRIITEAEVRRQPVRDRKEVELRIVIE